jgi:hypothetical protein
MYLFFGKAWISPTVPPTHTHTHTHTHTPLEYLVVEKYTHTLEYLVVKKPLGTLSPDFEEKSKNLEGTLFC